MENSYQRLRRLHTILIRTSSTSSAIYATGERMRFTGAVCNAWKRNGGKKTVDDIHYRHNLEKEERLRIADWLHSLPLVIIEERYLITHGGPPHRRTLKDMEDYAKAERPKISNGNAYAKWDEYSKLLHEKEQVL